MEEANDELGVERPLEEDIKRCIHFLDGMFLSVIRRIYSLNPHLELFDCGDG